MTLLSVFLAVVLATNAVYSASDWPGPRQVSTDVDGNQYIEAAAAEGGDNIRCYVAEFSEMTPRVVYNCKWMPTLCQNAVAYLGAGTNGPVEFHYDRNGDRHDERRHHACPDGWANVHCLNLVGLPNWYTSNDNGARDYPVMQKCAKEPKRYYYEKLNEFDKDGKPKVAPAGVIASCDEFPAASWIEGGSGAKKISGVKAWMTEQNWQGNMFRNLPASLSASFTCPQQHYRQGGNDADRMYPIFKFNFQMVHQPSNADIIWITANGVKCYCTGIRPTSCSASLRPGERTR
ncbi:hypothetical protein MYCTH_2125573 [Thermothelomyces thermophilus ATCC 42464]|uniref:Uncharacterized protein n=1 Tax=Thermothelomyces thermophilus (strain ATCC 42464 / BCRC 31852 / DSM 1799) TaxID=573729 RepID=G2Q9Y5_THET4|nr:uncharacterized protein MYCTH_2125573 [Thermothelomyces thermophilus ATCC 42464]AEO56589.1 hypothetical protein MYCTH_2125573 [Thermothelomyces thermophilus ATCC 42464]